MKANEIPAVLPTTADEGDQHFSKETFDVLKSIKSSVQKVEQGIKDLHATLPIQVKDCLDIDARFRELESETATLKALSSITMDDYSLKHSLFRRSLTEFDPEREVRHIVSLMEIQASSRGKHIELKHVKARPNMSKMI